MDTLLKNADIALDARGRPTAVSGVDELLQRALVRLTVKKGTFLYDPELGSRLYTLRAGGSNVQGTAESMVREALGPIRELTVESVEAAASRDQERMDIRVKLYAGGVKKELEVAV